MPQGVDRIQTGGPSGWEKTEYHSDKSRKRKGQ
jgi:hypothetical protein